MSSKRDDARKLKKAGLKYKEIGKIVGVSPQGARQLALETEKPDLHSKDMLTTGDVAQLLGVHRNTVRRWARSGILKPYRVGTRHDRRFPREEVNRFLGSSDSKRFLAP